MHEWTILTEGYPPHSGGKVTIIKSKRHHAVRLVKSLGALAATPIVLFLMLYLIFVIGYIAGVSSRGFGDLMNLVLNMPNTWRLLGIFAGCLLLASLIPRIARSLKVVLFGEKFIFDSEQGILLKDNRIIVQFNEVKRLEVKVSAGEMSNDYQLAVRLNNKGKVVIADSTNLEAIRELTREIVSVTDFRTVRIKPGLWPRTQAGHTDRWSVEHRSGEADEVGSHSGFRKTRPYLTFQLVTQHKLENVVKHRYASQIAALEKLGFGDLCIYVETAAPFSLVLAFPIVVMMLANREIIRIRGLLRFSIAHALLALEEYGAMAWVSAQGICFETNFTDGTWVRSTPRSSEDIGHRIVVHKYPSRSTARDAWNFHQDKVDKLVLQGRRLNTNVQFADYVEAALFEAHVLKHEMTSVSFIWIAIVGLLFSLVLGVLMLIIWSAAGM
jgi:hypothetical protein